MSNHSHFERGKPARWRRYGERWRRYLWTVKRLGPVLKTRPRPDLLPTRPAFARDYEADVRREYEGRYARRPEGTL